MSDKREEEVSHVHMSTPGEKQDYVKRWLNEIPLPSELSTADFDKLESNFITNDTQCEEIEEMKLFPSTPPQPPVLSEKRSASSPILGGLRKSFKRMKVGKKTAKLVEEKPSCSKSIVNEVCCKKNFDFEENSDPNISKEKIILEHHDSCNISAVSDHSRSENIVKPEIEPHSTQFIELVSSDGSTNNTEVRVQEAASDSDKTASDFIEETNSQLTIHESPEKSKQISQSQKISNPSSTSSDQTNDDHITETDTKDNTKLQSTEMSTSKDQVDTISTYNTNITEVQCTESPMDQIDTNSTSESKGGCSKMCILQPTNQKRSKKKKYKKDSLSELLHKTLANEKSSIHFLRHRLYTNSLDVAEPFVLLQIQKYLPNLNGKQFIQVTSIQDTANLLENIVKKKTDVITVIITPELSGVINVTQKPVLKVYEPWTVLDPRQLLIHITRFTTIPSSNENLDFSFQDNKVLKLVEEFHCPCIDKNALSNECKTKFSDSAKDSIELICD